MCRWQHRLFPLILLRVHTSSCVCACCFCKFWKIKTLKVTEQTPPKELHLLYQQRENCPAKERVTLNQRSGLKLLIPNCYEVLQTPSLFLKCPKQRVQPIFVPWRLGHKSVMLFVLIHWLFVVFLSFAIPTPGWNGAYSHFQPVSLATGVLGDSEQSSSALFSLDAYGRDPRALKVLCQVLHSTDPLHVDPYHVLRKLPSLCANKLPSLPLDVFSPAWLLLVVSCSAHAI